ncbi:unnamed protein product [Sphagnum tenellum]
MALKLVSIEATFNPIEYLQRLRSVCVEIQRLNVNKANKYQVADQMTTFKKFLAEGKAAAVLMSFYEQALFEDAKRRIISTTSLEYVSRTNRVIHNGRVTIESPAKWKLIQCAIKNIKIPEASMFMGFVETKQKEHLVFHGNHGGNYKVHKVSSFMDGHDLVERAISRGYHQVEVWDDPVISQFSYLKKIGELKNQNIKKAVPSPSVWERNEDYRLAVAA